eukprot:jgi/Chlat1/6056/Chrsp4S06336
MGGAMATAAAMPQCVHLAAAAAAVRSSRTAAQGVTRPAAGALLRARRSLRCQHQHRRLPFSVHASAAASSSSQAGVLDEPAVTPASSPSGSSVSRAYPFTDIEGKWQDYWDRHKTFCTPRAPDTTRPKFYALDMFPYPSGAGLHVGHPEGYTATDIISRYKRMRGFNVLHPMGWDAFGLPAEQYALETGTHPAVTTAKNINRFKQQLKSLGFSYDWDREISTTDEDYYKWTQWIFLRLFHRGLAYQAEAAVNWCPALGTVLANEEVVDGLSERGGHPVIRKPMKQWMLRITAYADRLLDDLDIVDWPDSIKEMQRNWIGRSEGAELSFAVEGHDSVGVNVFTTRPDTLFGATYLVLSPEHTLVREITTPEQKQQVEEYVAAAGFKSDLERTELQKEKTGVATGAYAINPVTGSRVPIWVADYVLASYGTGAIMAVPAHDSRDHEFAHMFGLEITTVVKPEDGELPEDEAYSGEGVMVNSASTTTGLDINGKSNKEAASLVIDWLEGVGIGQRKINYKLRDWLFARQRYWGEPFPIMYMDGSSEPVALPESELPLTLPSTDVFKPAGTGESPLAAIPEWVNTVDPTSGKPARRETNTMPQWAGSCWYYLRFMDSKNPDCPVDPELERYWGPVDLYVGGAEHSVLHLLYARFWHKVLYDDGVVSTKEPFYRLVNQGMILGEVEYTAYTDGSGVYVAPGTPGAKAVSLTEEQVVKKGDGWVVKDEPSVRVQARAHKMSKSRGNVVNPDEVVFQYGADSLRLYEMFMGPLRDTKTWSTRGVEGVHRFLARAWRLITELGLTDDAPTNEQLRVLHTTIQRVTEDTEEMRFNTAISAMMEFINASYKWDTRPRDVVAPFVLLLSPYAPHIAEELWERLGNSKSLAYHPWPEADATYLKTEEIQLPVQVNGKMRGLVSISVDADQQAAVAAALAEAKIAKFVEGKEVRKQIFVPGKMLNLIVK